MSFSDDVNAFVDKAIANNEEVVRSASISLFSAIIQSSPVDTGRFRGNWFASNQTPSSELSDAARFDTNLRMTQFVSSTPNWQHLTFTNNLPYARVIEFGGYNDGPNTTGGYSRQAPQGVVRVNVRRFDAFLESEAKKVI